MGGFLTVGGFWVFVFLFFFFFFFFVRLLLAKSHPGVVRGKALRLPLGEDF